MSGKHRSQPSRVIRRIVAGSAVGVGFGAAGMMGASPAQALGLSVDLNGDGTSFDVGTGATTTQSGNASNNPALAVSLFRPASTSATGDAQNNVLVAIDGQVAVSGNSNGNTIVAVGNKSVSTGQGKKAGEFSFSACGTSFSGQADHVTISNGVC